VTGRIAFVWPDFVHADEELQEREKFHLECFSRRFAQAIAQLPISIVLLLPVSTHRTPPTSIER